MTISKSFRICFCNFFKAPFFLLLFWLVVFRIISAFLFATFFATTILVYRNIVVIIKIFFLGTNSFQPFFFGQLIVIICLFFRTISTSEFQSFLFLIVTFLHVTGRF